MFESPKETFLAVLVVLFSAIYSMLFVFMVKRNRLFSEKLRNILGFSSVSERAEKFYKMLMKSLENDLINNIDDVMNMYSGITGFSYSKDEKRYYLGRRLRGFLVYMLKQDGIEKEILKKWKDIVTGFINELETEAPYADVPSSERRVLLEINRSIDNEEYGGIKGRLDDLAGMIQNRNEGLSKATRINRWSVPLTVIGLLLTITFGALSLYLTFRPTKDVILSKTPVQQTDKTSVQIDEN